MLLVGHCILGGGGGMGSRFKQLKDIEPENKRFKRLIIFKQLKLFIVIVMYFLRNLRVYLSPMSPNTGYWCVKSRIFSPAALVSNLIFSLIN